jgi:hypothetical protein
VLGTGCTLLNGCKGKTVYKSKSSSTFKKNGTKITIAADVAGIISNDLVNLGGVNSKMDFAEIGKPPKNKFADSSVTGVLGLGFPGAIIGGIEKTFMDQVDSEEKSFEVNLHKNPDQSYLLIPGKDFGEENATHDTHYIVEKHFWGIHIDYLQQDKEHKILTPKHLVTLDTSSSLIHGPKEVISPLIAGIEVASDCSNVAALPQIHFALDGQVYTLSGSDYVQKVGAKCQMGIVATEAADKYIHLGTQFITKHSPVYFNYGQGYVQLTRPTEATEEAVFIQ